MVFLIVASGFSRTIAAQGPLQPAALDGRRTVGAVLARAPIVPDGVLDEEVWRMAAPAGDFVQAEPHEGQPATESTEVRLAFDGDALYLGVICRDSAPSGLIINDIRKDFVAGEQDSFEVILDTFADRRNGFVFVVNPVGAKSDAQIANEGRDVNTSWECAVNESTQPVQVRPKEVSVRLGSYPGDGEGNRAVEAPGTEVRLGWASKCAGRNASEA